MIQLFVDVVFTESVPDSQEDETLRRQKTKRSNNETTIMNIMDCAGREGGGLCREGGRGRGISIITTHTWSPTKKFTKRSEEMVFGGGGSYHPSRVTII